MVKGNFLDDTFEQALEFGQSTVKASAQAVKTTFSPLKILENTKGLVSKQNDQGKEKIEKGQVNKQNHTKLDFEKLNSKYQNQDKVKTEALRYKLFQLVKSGEEKVLYEKKRDEEEKKQKLIYEEQEKKRKLFEKGKQEMPIPQGKQRRSIFSHKKVAQRQQTEVKPSSGKQ